MNDEALDLLTDLLEYFDERADADCVDGRFVGNEAMGHAQDIREVLRKAGRNVE